MHLIAILEQLLLTPCFQSIATLAANLISGYEATIRGAAVHRREHPGSRPQGFGPSAPYLSH